MNEARAEGDISFFVDGDPTDHRAYESGCGPYDRGEHCDEPNPSRRDLESPGFLLVNESADKGAAVWGKVIDRAVFEFLPYASVVVARNLDIEFECFFGKTPTEDRFNPFI